jgi:hypothetical protein
VATGTCRHVTPYWSIFKKSRHLGFGVLIDIWSMMVKNMGLIYKVKKKKKTWIGIFCENLVVLIFAKISKNFKENVI